jgi:hypothetical protein
MVEGEEILPFLFYTMRLLHLLAFVKLEMAEAKSGILEIVQCI